VPAAGLAFITDITTADAFGRPVVSQGIFDAVLGLIAGARRLVVLDYAAFGRTPDETAPQRHVAAALTDTLLARWREQRDLAILFITDPANEGYGASESEDLQLLRAAGAVIEIGRQTPFAQQALAYFDSLWANRAPRGIEYTADFAVFADPAQSDYWLYRLMEASGLSEF